MAEEWKGKLALRGESKPGMHSAESSGTYVADDADYHQAMDKYTRTEMERTPKMIRMPQKDLNELGQDTTKWRR